MHQGFSALKARFIHARCLASVAGGLKRVGRAFSAWERDEGDVPGALPQAGLNSAFGAKCILTPLNLRPRKTQRTEGPWAAQAESLCSAFTANREYWKDRLEKQRYSLIPVQVVCGLPALRCF